MLKGLTKLTLKKGLLNFGEESSGGGGGGEEPIDYTRLAFATTGASTGDATIRNFFGATGEYLVP